MSDENFSGSLGVNGHIRIGQGATAIRLEAGGTSANPTLSVGVGTAASIPLSTASVGMPMSSGKWFNPNGTGASGTVGANARAVMYRVAFGKSCTLNGISVDVTVNGDAASKIRFGIYDETDGLPGALIQDFGTVAGDSTSANPLTISQAVNARWYWICSAFQLMPSVQTTVRMANFVATPLMVGTASPGGSSMNEGYFFDTGFSGALPASAGAPTGTLTSSNNPSIWLKAA